MQPSHRQNVLRAYKTLIDLIHRLPAAERASALAEARATVRGGDLGVPHVDVIVVQTHHAFPFLHSSNHANQRQMPLLHMTCCVR